MTGVHLPPEHALHGPEVVGDVGVDPAVAGVILEDRLAELFELFLGDLYRLVEDCPSDTLVARGRGKATVVTIEAGQLRG